MANSKPPSPIPICAHLGSIEIVGDLDKNKREYFVSISVDEHFQQKSAKKPSLPAPRWEWPQNQQFLFHPSSTIKIKVYRESRARLATLKHSVGEYNGKVIELLESDALIDLEDKDGTTITPKVKVKLTLVPTSGDNFQTFMETISTNVSHLDNTGHAPAVLLALGRAFELTKAIMDIVSNAHPILKASWTVMSTVYGAVQQAQVVDDTIRDLAESLREMLGIATQCLDLKVIEGTTNVIEEIGRTSLKTTSLVHEYTRLGFMRRVVTLQLSDNMKTRITQYQKSCDGLREKFKIRLILETNNVVKETKADMDKNNANIQRTLDTIQDDHLADRIWKWLSAPDSSKNYNEAREKHHADTCEWFLSGTWFREFDEKAGILWINGTAGCGKTILCSSIVEKIISLHAKKPSVTCVYFFFDGRDSQQDFQQHDKLIRSLIRQLCAYCDGIPSALVQLYGQGHQQPRIRSLQDTLHLLLEGFDSVYIVIDSLDECIEREKMLLWIEQIISFKMSNLHLVVASRPERDITDTLRSLSTCFMDSVGEVDKDIAKYLDEELRLVKKWDEETREKVKAALRKGAQGMFRWVALQLLELKKCPSPHAVVTQLDSLPKGLFESYDRILSTIDRESDCVDTKIFLRWLCFSACPMTLEEVAETVVVDFSVEDEPRCELSQRYYDQRDVLEKCSGFVIESYGKIKLAHFSIKEYLLSKHLHDTVATSSFHLSSPEHSHFLISQACLVYILQFDKRPLKADLLYSFPLARYAAEFWISHAHSSNVNKSDASLIWSLAKNLFTTKGNVLINWVRVCDLDKPYIAQNLDRTIIAAPLYYASLAGLPPIVRYLLDSEAIDVNAKGGDYYTALQAASFEGQHEIVELLLEKGAEVNLQGGEYGNALQAASFRGNEVIVELLLAEGADVNAQGGKYGSALEAAAHRGHHDIVQLLLASGANVNLQRGRGLYTDALQAATDGEEYEIVKLLLENGADVNAKGKINGNALQLACSRGNYQIVKLLLEEGADVNAPGRGYGNALHIASSRGQLEIIELLLENGAEIDALGGGFGNALQAAVVEGQHAAVELLLESGADVNAPGGSWGRALHAATRGKSPIVQLLLDNGANVNALGGTYGTALQAASHWGNESIVRLLLENGADVNTKAGYHGTALQAASRNHAIIKLLLENGADADLQGGRYGTAIQAYAHAGNDVMVKLLLEHGADVNAMGGQYGSALQAAICAGHDTTIELLLEKGANVNLQGGEYGTALQAAAYWGHSDKVVQILLDKGADVNIQGGKYCTALQAASDERRQSIFNLLLERGADVTLQGGKYGNAVQSVASRGNGKMLDLLLQNGADVNGEGGEFGNALQAALFRGLGASDMAKLLVKKGADVNMQSRGHVSVLHLASFQGKDWIVRGLLELGADVNRLGGYYGHALYAAAHGGHEKVMRLLLESGATVNPHGGEYENALRAARARGHDGVVKLLTEAGEGGSSVLQEHESSHTS